MIECLYHSFSKGCPLLQRLMATAEMKEWAERERQLRYVSSRMVGVTITGCQKKGTQWFWMFKKGFLFVGQKWYFLERPV